MANTRTQLFQMTLKKLQGKVGTFFRATSIEISAQVAQWCDIDRAQSQNRALLIVSI